MPHTPPEIPSMDLAPGQTFGRLTILSLAGYSGKLKKWLCLCTCGKETVVFGCNLSRGHTQSCGCLHRECNWRTRRSTDGHGYVRVLAKGHPRANQKGYVCEHRLIMEQMLGRQLLPHETVHHINGVRHDNRPENLELWVSHQPSGQRPEDLIKWARRILITYAPETTYEGTMD